MKLIFDDNKLCDFFYILFKGVFFFLLVYIEDIFEYIMMVVFIDIVWWKIDISFFKGMMEMEDL